MHQMILHARFLMTGFIGLICVVGQCQTIQQHAPDQRHEVPAEETSKEQLRAIRMLKREDKQRATALLQFLAENELPPSEKYIVLCETCEQAITDGNPTVWQSANELIVSGYQVDEWETTTTGLIEFAKKNPDEFLRSSLYDYTMKQCEATSRSLNFEEPNVFLRKLISSLRSTGSKVDRLKTKKELYQDLAAIFANYQSAVRENAKANPDARTEGYLAIWEIIWNENWDEAVSLLNECKSEKFRDFRNAAFAERGGDIGKAVEVWIKLAKNRKFWLALRRSIATHVVDLMDTRIANESSLLIKKALEKDLAEFKSYCVETLELLQDEGSSLVPIIFRNRLGADRKNAIEDRHISPETLAAIDQGLQWLSKVQPESGGWSLKGPFLDGADLECRCAATSLALLAFLGEGHSHKYGDYQNQIRSGLNFLVNMQARDGTFREQGVLSARFSYAQAMATLALCEAYGLTQDRWLKTHAQNAVTACEKRQSSLGGWRYESRADADTSVTGWYISALTTAKHAGLNVSNQTLMSARNYLDNVVGKDGESYSYMIGTKTSPSASAIGLASHFQLGWTKGKVYFNLSASRWIRHYADPKAEKNIYATYYASQLANFAGGRYWDDWNKVSLAGLVEAQRRFGGEEGSWDPANDKYGGQKSGQAGRLFQTCFSLLCLEAGYRTNYQELAAQSIESTAERKYALALSNNAFLRTDLKYTGNTPITIEAIVTPISPKPTNTIVGNFDNAGLGIRIIDSKFDMLWHNKGKYVSVNSGVAALSGQRVHVAGVATGQQIAIFVNGVLCGTKQTNGHKASALKFLVAADPGPRGEPQHRFGGLYEFLRISNVVRYNSNFRVPSVLDQDDSTVLLYDFRERQDRLVEDKSGFGHDGTNHGGVWVLR